MVDEDDLDFTKLGNILKKKFIFIENNLHYSEKYSKAKLLQRMNLR